MHRFHGIVLALAATAIVTSGCSRQGPRRVVAPPRIPGPEDVRDARWLTDAEAVGAAARAARSPLYQQAVREQAAPNPYLSLHAQGIVGAVGTGPDGSAVRFTIVPYRYSNDPDRAMYFAYLERDGRTRVEAFELMRRRPAAADSGFDPVNGTGLWMRSGPLYVRTATGTARLSPERWHWEKFAACFVMMGELNLGYANQFCDEMGNFPHCRIIATTIAVVFTAIYCAYAAFS